VTRVRGATASPAGDPTLTVVENIDAFISYSRHDAALVDRLAHDLEAKGKHVFIDREGIEKGSLWRERLTRAIRAASSTVFVLTPESAASVECQREIDIAVAENKRLIVVMGRETPPVGLREEIREVNWISFCEDAKVARTDSYAVALDELVSALELDVAWRDRHARLAERAEQWLASERNHSFLMRGRDLKEAEDWYTAKAGHREQPTDAQYQYILASRRNSARRQRILLGAVAAALAVTLALGVVALVERQAALAQRQQALDDLAVAQANEMAQGASTLFSTDTPLGMLLSLEANRRSPTLQARQALVEAAEEPLATDVPVPATGSPGSAALATRALASGDCAAHPDDIGDGSVNTPSVNALAYSPAGGVFATGDEDGEVVLWRASTDSALAIFCVDDGQAIESLAFSRDGRLLAVGDLGGEISVYDVATRKPVAASVRLNPGSPSVAFSPDGSLLLATDPYSNGALVLKAATLAYVGVIAETKSRSPVTTVAFGCGFVALGASGGVVTLISLTQAKFRQHVLTDLGGAARAMSFSPDCSYLAVGEGSTGYVALFDLKRSGAAPVLLATPDAQDVSSVSFNRSGTMLAAGTGSGAITVWRLQDLVETLSFDDGSTDLVAFSTSDATLVSVDDDGRVIVWNTGPSTGDVLRLRGTSLYSVALSPDGSTVALADADLSAQLVATGTGAVRSLDPEGHFGGVAFSPDGAFIAGIVGSPSKRAAASVSVVVWNARSGATVATLPDSSLGDAGAIGFGPQDTLVVSGKGTLTLYRFGAHDTVSSLPLPSGEAGASSIAFAPRGADLAAGGLLGHATVYDSRDGKTITTLMVPDHSELDALAFSPDGGMLAAGDYAGQVTVFDLRTGVAKQGFDIGSHVNDIAWSTAGQLAVGDALGRVTIFDLAGGSEVAQLAMGSSIVGLGFNPAGTALIVGTAGGELLGLRNDLWDWSLSKFSSLVCGELHQSMTATEWSAYVPDAPYSPTCPS
jgi:WD40 repeat protein